MNVMHIISGGDTGGAKTHVVSLTSKLREFDTVHIVCFVEAEFSKEAREAGVKVTVVNEGGMLKDRNRILDIIREEKTEIIHCHGAKGNLMGMLLKKKARLPMVTTIHSDYRLDYMGRPLAALTYGNINKIALRKFDGYIGVSDATAEMMTERGFDKDSVFVLYNGVDFDRVPNPVPRSEYLSSLGIDPAKTVYGIAARISPIKDMTTLVKAFAKAHAECPDTALIIAGEGEEETQIKALAAELCPDNSVVFAGWVKDMDSFFNALDVNMITSVSEGFPYALPEGARLHCAEISSNVGGIPSFIEDKVTGLLFEPRNVDELAECIKIYAADKEYRTKLADALYARAEKDFSLKAMAEKQHAIYERIVSN